MTVAARRLRGSVHTPVDRLAAPPSLQTAARCKEPWRRASARPLWPGGRRGPAGAYRRRGPRRRLRAAAAAPARQIRDATATGIAWQGGGGGGTGGRKSQGCPAGSSLAGRALGCADPSRRGGYLVAAQSAAAQPRCPLPPLLTLVFAAGCGGGRHSPPPPPPPYGKGRVGKCVRPLPLLTNPNERGRPFQAAPAVAVSAARRRPRNGGTNPNRSRGRANAHYREGA